MAAKTTRFRQGNIDPRRWDRLKTILGEALEQNSSAARIALVERRCGEETDLLEEAESLLAEAEALLTERTDSFEDCVQNAASTFWQEGPLRAGERVGAYVIVRELGRGGMGTVFLAERADGQFEKQVAIKILSRGADTAEILHRFRAERQILAKLDHPNIARLLDAGTTDDGLPYFIMDYIVGAPVTRFAVAQKLSTRQRLDLFLKICDAVEFAHRNLVVHRDIKPSNILANAEGEPKLLDFGIAKLLAKDQDAAQSTAEAQQRLTPICASPEQAKGDPITVATDIYSLGALLYEMLSDQKPHRFSTARPTREELALVVGEQVPPPPSAVASDAQTARLLRGDLDAIVLFAMRKEPKMRYPTVADFAADVRRHLARQPVLARHPTLGYRAKCLVKRNGSRFVTSVAVVIVLAGVLFAFWARSQQNAGEAAAIAQKSIAVLPFENLSRDPDNAYFAEAIQDEILARLSKIADLKVISRTSTQKYKSAPDNLREVAKQLGVANILEGSVQKAADHVRVNVQLINAPNDAHLWGDIYDRKLTDIFAVESDIAKTIADTLQAELTGAEKQLIAAQPTSDTAAYELYLKGRLLWGKRSGDNIPKAIGFYEQAITRDPNYALAYAGLAEAYVLLPAYTATAPRDAYPKAKSAALKALQLDDKLAEAHTALGELLCISDLDMAGSISEFQHAIALNPNYATAHHWYGNGPLLNLGRFDEAIAEGKRAIELDPFSPIINADLGQDLFCARRYDEAIAQLRKTLEIDPTFYYAHYHMGLALQLKGDLPAAIAEFTKAQQLSDDLFVSVLLASAKAKLGDRDAAVRMLSELEELSQHRYVGSLWRTFLYLSLGNRDEAVRWLEQAVADHDTLSVMMIKIDPQLDPLRGDPRFEALVQKVVGAKHK
ncbi:MAG TPA: protein kinase [Candidatus Udaeobacter sp.]|jgi:serine/threonine protein kinase/Tfp pilus assembly protein PilF